MNKKLHVFLLSVVIGSSFQNCFGNPGGRIAMASLFTGQATLIGVGIQKVLAQQPTTLIDLGSTAGIVAMGTAVVVAPVVYGWEAGSKNYQCDWDAQIYRYRHESSMRKNLQSIACGNGIGVKKLAEYTEEDKKESSHYYNYKQLLSDQYSLDRFKELHENPSPFLSAMLFRLSYTPTITAPLNVLLGLAYDSPELLASGMAVNCLMAGTAYITEKNRLKKLQKLINQIDNEVYKDAKDQFTNESIEGKVQLLIDDVAASKKEMYAGKTPRDVGYPSSDDIERMVRKKIEEKR